MTKTENPKHIGINGAAGTIGKAICRVLQERGHTIRATDIVEVTGIGDEYIQADICDPVAMTNFCEGLDILIHLAAYPNEADFHEKLLKPNLIGTYEVFMAAQACGVDYLIGTSSVQVNNASPFREKKICLDDPLMPTNQYGVSKIYQEAMGQMFAQVHKMKVLMVRPGWYLRGEDQLESMERKENAPEPVFISHDDAANFYICAVENHTLKNGDYAVLWMMSKTKHENCGFDMAPAKALISYEPKDYFPDGLHFEQ